MKNTVLVISSFYTGGGHNSITSAIKADIENRGMETKIIDGFSLAGRAGITIGRLYGPITRYAGELWNFIWKVQYNYPDVTNKITRQAIKKNLLKIINETDPCLIISVHPSFNGSVLDILSENNLNIPFKTLIADPVTISPLWTDKRAESIICPTYEAYQKCRELGMDDKALRQMPFPIRKEFFMSEKDPYTKIMLKNNKDIKIILISGGEGSGQLMSTANLLLSSFSCSVIVVTGKNKVLYKKLKRSIKPEYKNKLFVYGYTPELSELLAGSDIAITRASPNTMLEAVLTNTPLVVLGSLGGQENGNPYFVKKYGIGVVCNGVERLTETLDMVLDMSSGVLKSICYHQKNFAQSYKNLDYADYFLRSDNA